MCVCVRRGRALECVFEAEKSSGLQQDLITLLQIYLMDFLCLARESMQVVDWWEFLTNP